MRRIFLIQLSVYALCSSFFWTARAQADLLSSDGSCSCGGKRDSSLDQLIFDASSLNADDPAINNGHLDDLGVQSESVLTATPGFASDVLDSSEMPVDVTLSTTITENMAFIDGGLFYMGTDNPTIHTDGEGPRRMVNLTDFMIDRLTLILSTFTVIDNSSTSLI
jgi:formylglycine-generating enzyme required for sulfatase activity